MKKSVLAVPLTALVTGVLLAGTALPAQAAIDTSVQSTGQYLTGSLMNSMVTAATPRAAASHAVGEASDLHEPTGDLEALALQTLALVGNSVGLPADFSEVGVMRVHAQANDDGSGLGSSGLLNLDGSIQKPAPQSATGKTLYDLSQAVGGTGLPGQAELGSLSLSLGATSSSASRSAAGAIARDYDIASGSLTFRSPTLAGISASVADRISALQATLDSFSGTAGPVAAGLNALTDPPLSSEVTVTPVDLAAGANSVPRGMLSDAAHPGVSVDLATGDVTIDLAAIITQNGLPVTNGVNDLPANTELITPALVQSINESISALIADYGNRVTAAVTAALNPVVVRAVASPPDNTDLDLTQTIGQIIAGLPVTPAAAPASVTGAQLAAVLTTAISGLTDGLGALTSTLLTPVTATTFPAISSLLAGALQLTVNVQSRSTQDVAYADGATPILSTTFREAALRITLLPSTFPNDLLVLSLANSSVTAPGTFGSAGPNAGTDAPMLAYTGVDASGSLAVLAITALLVGLALAAGSLLGNSGRALHRA